MIDDDPSVGAGSAVPDDEDDHNPEYDDIYYSDGSDVAFVLTTDKDWEDWLRVKGLQDKHPGLHLMKVVNYTPSRFKEIEAWAGEFCQGVWKRIEWYGSCSYTVIIGFANTTDAIYYKLRWQ